MDRNMVQERHVRPPSLCLPDFGDDSKACRCFGCSPVNFPGQTLSLSLDTETSGSTGLAE